MTASNFAACLAFTLKYEGGKVDDRRDPGGRTNQGVTQHTYAVWRAKTGLVSGDVYAMAPAERDAIYRTGFWAAVQADTLPAGVDLAVFDFAVNSGPARALRAYGKRSSNNPAGVVRTVCANRLSFLHALGTFRTFGHGWTARVAACEAVGVRMAEHARIGLAPDSPAAAPVASILRAAGRTAGASARRQGTAAATLATGGAMAHPAAATAVHVPWAALGASAFLLSAIVGLLLWRAHVAQARAAAYAAAAL